MPKAGVTLGILALGVVLGLGTAFAVGGGTADGGSDDETPGAATTPACDGGTEPLDVAADEAVVPIIRTAAQRYTEALAAEGIDCVDIRVRAVSSSAVVGRLANGWRAPTHGPTPEVWIPQSTVWVELLRAELEDPSLVDTEPTVLARSPTVMAMPMPMAEELGWPDAELTWTQLTEYADAPEGWAALDRPEWGPFKLWMTDPRYTTLGLQTLLALDAAQGDGGGGGETDEGVPLSLFRVQRLLSAIDPNTGEQLDRLEAAQEPLGTVSAMPLEERQVWAHNTGGEPVDLGSPAPTASDGGATTDDGRVKLAALRPAGFEDVALESDYPYVVLDAPWVAQDVLQYADEFGGFLLSDEVRELFAEAGFRDPENRVAPAMEDGDGVEAVDVASGPPPDDLPDVSELQQLRADWVNVPRLSTTLFVIDVSGSMVQAVPGTDLTRLQATIEAGKRTLAVIPRGGSVGLWEFSTNLQGGRNDGDYRELVTVGPLTEEVYGTTRRQRLLTAFDELDAEQDTALYDTVVAAYREMQSLWTPGNSHTIVLLTDGRNDDENSITQERMIEILELERDVNKPVRVVSIAYGDEADVDELALISDTVGGKVISSPELENLDRLFIEALSGPTLDRS